ncbi:hypothetical protein pb186bvf_019181 [Paramecium bursaria]
MYGNLITHNQNKKLLLRQIEYQLIKLQQPLLLKQNNRQKYEFLCILSAFYSTLK